MGMRFGDSVALLGTKLAVGAPLKSTTTNAEAGSIYYYANYSVAPTRTIDGGMANGNLGQSVAFNSMGLFTGCPFCNSRAGLVNYHSFTKLNSSSAVDYQIFGLNQAANDGFGYAIATSGTDIIVGAFIKSDPNNNSGAAYIYVMK